MWSLRDGVHIRHVAQGACKFMYNVRVLGPIVSCQDPVSGHATEPFLSLAMHNKYSTRYLTHTPNASPHVHAGKVGLRNTKHPRASQLGVEISTSTRTAV